MTDTHPIDWRFYFRPDPWVAVRSSPSLPLAARDALSTIAPDFDELAQGTDPPLPETPRGGLLVALTAADASSLGRRGLQRLADVACVVMLHPAPAGRRPGGGGSRGGPPAALTVQRVDLPGRRTVHYPPGSAAARRLVWGSVARSASVRGRLARLGASAGRISAITLLRGETVEFICPRERLLPVAEHLVVLSSGHTESNPAILVLPRGPEDADILIKAPRSPAYARNLAPEARKLARLRRVLPGVEPGPRPVPPGVLWPGTAQTFLAGQAMDRHPPEERAALLYKAASMLLDLERASTRAARAGLLRPPDCRRYLNSQIAAASTYGVVTPPHDDRLRGLAGELAGSGLGLVLCHGDAGAWNIVARNGQPHLVDWESAGWGLPGEDLLYLLLFLVYQDAGVVGPAARVEAFRSRFLDPEGRPEWLRGCLLRLSRHLRVAGPGLQALLAATILRHATTQYLMTRFDSGREALTEPFREILAVVLDGGPGPWTAAGLRGRRGGVG